MRTLNNKLNITQRHWIISSTAWRIDIFELRPPRYFPFCNILIVKTGRAAFYLGLPNAERRIRKHLKLNTVACDLRQVLLWLLIRFFLWLLHHRLSSCCAPQSTYLDWNSLIFYFLAVWSRASCLTSLCLIWKIEIIVVSLNKLVYVWSVWTSAW